MEPQKTPRERAEDLVSLLVLDDWRPTTRQVLWFVRIATVLGIAVAIGYAYGITLWDWLKLLVVPAVIAGGGIWFNRQQRERELEIAREQREQEVEIAERRTQDEALQAYLDQMSSMLIPNADQPSLYRARPGDSLSSVARARTLAVLQRLDGYRKAQVVKFLYESGLISSAHPVLDLRNADLKWVILNGINLRGANLSRASLAGAQLVAADLRGAILDTAVLQQALLTSALLQGASLDLAVLYKAHLYKADLRGANLSRAIDCTERQLMTAKSLEGATMPNGQKYEDWLKDRGGRAGDAEND